ncbi:MAG: glycosyltransferase family 2 protein [Caulobacteraceae bacterium]
MPSPPIDISVLIPCLNEAENVANITRAVTAEMNKAGVSYEIVFIDNASTDGTVDIIKAICASDPRVRLIVNNKNYGQMRSPTHGIYQTSGRAVIGISADFQDPPEMIGEFITRWRRGARIILGVRQSEDTSLLMRFIRAVGYGFFERFADYRVIPGATGFGLYDREVVDCLEKWREPEPFFRGMLVESGFSLETIPYHRPPRVAGASKNNLWTLLGLALAGVAGSSKRLLRAPIYVSVLTFAAAGLTLIGALAWAMLGHDAWGGLIAAVLEFAFALIFMFLGLIGEQVRLISEVARNVPLVVEKERVNFPNP